LGGLGVFLGLKIWVFSQNLGIPWKGIVPWEGYLLNPILKYLT